MFMKKRGQAAIEFLMTYGWAILVVLVVIGALAYFGILNPQQFLPQKCQFSTGFYCQDNIIKSTGGGTIRVNNGLGNDIRVYHLNFTSNNGVVTCIYDNTAGYILTAGAEYNFNFNTTLNTKCDATTMAQFKGSRIRGDLNAIYADLQSGFNHTIEGELLTDVE